MSYTVTLGCGCRVYVSCHPRTGREHRHVIEARSAECAIRSHGIGVEVPVWELLPYEPDDPMECRRTQTYRRALERAAPPGRHAP